MGYTHYFNTVEIHGKATEQERKYQLALKQCRKIAKYYNDDVKTYYGPKTDLRLSGYTVHAPKYGGLSINGVQGEAHEDFCMREHFKENKAEFCKTARKPYDQVVVACLVVLKHYLGDGFAVESDGDAHEWVNGRDLAREALGLKSLKIPKSIFRAQVRLKSVL